MTTPSKPAGLSGGLSFLEPRGDVLPRPHGNTYWLWARHILAGEHPATNGEENLSERLFMLSQAGITHFIDLTMPTESYKPYPAPEGTVRLNFPIADFGVPSVSQMQAILQTIQSAIENGGQVFLHCRAGIGRTGTVSATWLVEQGLDSEAALALLLQKWQSMDKNKSEPHTPETEAQRQFVINWRTAIQAKVLSKSWL